MGKMVFDGSRAADYLQSLPFVDPDRLGCIGHSLGAKETLYAAAFDERFRAAVSSEGGIGLTMSNWEAIWYLGADIRESDFAHENHEVSRSSRLRPFLLIRARSDGSRVGHSSRKPRPPMTFWAPVTVSRAPDPLQRPCVPTHCRAVRV
jgi:pimeloyl-ACP methyl ester carboxylesterase